MDFENNEICDLPDPSFSTTQRRRAVVVRLVRRVFNVLWIESPSSVYGSTINGPGLPLFTEQQGRRSMGTVGALVTDGSSVYALTSRHVLGPPGSTFVAAQQGRMIPIGVAAISAARRAPARARWSGSVSAHRACPLRPARSRRGSLRRGRPSS